MKRHEKAQELKKLILALHEGEAFDQVKARFDELIAGVSPEEIAAMEQQLIQEGMPVAEVQRLCDLHVAVVRGGLQSEEGAGVPPGHPVHTYMAENRDSEKLADLLIQAAEALERAGEGLPDPSDLAGRLDALAAIDLHYLRKENQLFPYLERHGVTGPTQVMWGIHDEIRVALRSLKKRITEGDVDGISSDVAELARAITEMIYKEEKILFPLALKKLSQDEWIEMRRGEGEIGYAFGDPIEWPEEPQEAGNGAAEGRAGMIDLSTGQLSVEQLDRILTHLPVDVSFVDSEGRVQFYSDNADRIFPRTPAVIGRSVANCHPPKSGDKVLQILAAFKDGSRDRARFWIQLGGKFILIQYFAVRSRDGSYLGCLEVSQDVTEIRDLQGDNHLLDWS